LDCCDHSQLSAPASEVGVPIETTSKPPAPWPHAPPHWILSPGTYFVTASTFSKARLFDTPRKLNLAIRHLIDTAKANDWTLHAWAVLSNHYHLLADSPQGSGETLRRWLREFHRATAIAMNELDETPGRRIWQNFRETLITHQTSFLARLHYVNENAVHHRLVTTARQYPWCSAAWFETNAPKSFVTSVARFKADKLNVYDDFAP
jgi:putative transposase